jgi:hypothetical protein
VASQLGQNNKDDRIEDDQTLDFISQWYSAHAVAFGLPLNEHMCVLPDI